MISKFQAVDINSLAIVDLLKERFEILAREVGPTGNIYMVFMHDLVVHFSGILIHRVALEHYSDPVIFPWINKSYSLFPYRCDSTGLSKINHNLNLKTRLRRLPLSRVALGEALPFGYHQDRLSAKIINLLGSYKPFTCAYLPHRDEQIEELLNCIGEICKLYDIVNPDVVRHNWYQYVKCHTANERTVLRERGLLVGTRNNLQNRKLAVNYLQQGIEVIAITHGEVANSVMDESPFGYSERTLCTTLIDYGDFDEDGQHNVPLIPPQQRFYRNAPVARSVYKPADNISPPGQRNYKALYIPTTYTGNGLYGPFHAYEDAVYRRWQFALFKGFPSLILKAHPKSRSQPPAGIVVEHRQLEDCIDDYELLVFDYFATGSMLALLSNKPLIYFDIGLRRLHPEFSRDLKGRCEYAKIDMQSEIDEQIKETLRNYWSTGVSQSNTQMVRYAFCHNSEFSWTNLFKAASRGTSPL